MKEMKRIRRLIYIVVFCWLLVGSGFQSKAVLAEEKPESTGLAIKKNIRVVYQIKTDDWKEGIGSGLHYVRKLADAYNKMDISEDTRFIHAVFHGSAGYWMLKDRSYNEFKDTREGNPNKEVIEELAKRGVSLELCAQTMKSRGWSAGDIHPDVEIVIGAYPRIIDLQLQGYAYIRF